MSRNITAAQKRAWDFHKSDVLAQTNQIKYDCFVLHGTERSKSRNENPGHVFLDFILFFNITVKKIGKRITGSNWGSRKRFF